MTDTRKQIIELIEPFMVVSLSDGCLIQTIEHGIKYASNRYIFTGNGTIFYDNGLDPYLYSENYKILGHYDITAVLKYIDKYNFGSIIITEHEIVTSIGNKNACIPNKPLSLYTEKEEKDLLELLKKIGQTNR